MGHLIPFRDQCLLPLRQCSLIGEVADSQPLALQAAEPLLHLSVPAAVAVFVAEPPEELGGGVPLLGRCGPIVKEDLVDDRLDRPEKRSESVSGRQQGIRFGLLEDSPDSVSRMLKFDHDLTDGLAIASP
jgi:hypothetical protein